MSTPEISVFQVPRSSDGAASARKVVVVGGCVVVDEAVVDVVDEAVVEVVVDEAGELSGAHDPTRSVRMSRAARGTVLM